MKFPITIFIQLVYLCRFSTSFPVSSKVKSFKLNDNAYLSISKIPLQKQVINRHMDCSLKSTHSDSIPKLSGIKQSKVKILINSATNIFPFWVLLSCLVGNIKPSYLQWFSPYITPALALTMLSMGMTLTIDDFSRVFKQPQLIAVGFLAQYLIMPASAYMIAKFMKLGNELSTGLILVGCAPGGTASNLVSLIGEVDVPLSVLMTLASTIAAVFMTPFLVTLLTKSYVPVKSAELVYSTLQVVLAPVIAGVTMNTLLPSFCSKISEYAALPCVLLVSMICGTVTASNKGLVLGANMGSKLLISIILLHSFGFALGYLFAKGLKSSEQQARTISIETGMQNSALAVVLSRHFPNPALVALPGSISATVHSVIGSMLATYFRWTNRSSKSRLLVNQNTIIS